MVDHGLPGQAVVRVRDAAAQFRGYPRVVRTDQEPEFTGKALDQWARERGVQLKLIAPGKLTQNAYNESFNGKFRDECLNEHWFTSFRHARGIAVAWRRDDNERGSHSALGYQTPAAFAARARALALEHSPSSTRKARKSDNV